MPKTTKQAESVDLKQLTALNAGDTPGLSFDVTIAQLQGGRALQAYREMADHSAVIGACLFAIEMLLRKVKWTVKPGNPGSEEADRARILEGMLHDMSRSWEDTVTEILSMIVYGFAPMEVVYKIRKGPEETDARFRSKFADGNVGWRKWVLIPQESVNDWIWDNDGGLAGVEQEPSAGASNLIQVPIEKMLLFRTKTAKNNPMGKSLLLNAWFPWQFSKKIVELEGIGVERDFAGLPMALVPPEYLDADASAEMQNSLAAIKKLVQTVRRNENDGIVFPMAFDDENNPLYEFKLLATGGMRQFDTNKIVERHERRMAMSLLSDVIMMGHERVGSLALSRDKTTLFGRALSGIAQSVAAVINRHAVPKVYAINGWDQTDISQYVPGEAEGVDLKTLSAFIRNLVAVGAITPDPPLEDALREAGDLPKADPSFSGGPRQTAEGPDDEEEDDGEKGDESQEPGAEGDAESGSEVQQKSAMQDIQEKAEARRKKRKKRRRR